jgi:ATP-dependent Clp protease ATP-binding subunit ClpA
VFERFTDGARRATVDAQEEARRHGCGAIEPGHLALALLRLPDDPGIARTLGTLVPSVVALYPEVDAVVPRGGRDETASIPFSEDAKQVFVDAVVAARGAGGKHVGTEHLLYAVSGVRSIGDALAHAGVGREALLSSIQGAPPASGFEVRTTRGLGRFRRGGKAPG